MTSENVSESEAVKLSKAASVKAVDDQLVDELVGRGKAVALELTGEGKITTTSAMPSTMRRGWPWRQ